MHLRRAVALFLPCLILSTLLCGLVYVVAQQALRMAANDPQEQLARDAARRLDAGEPAASVIGPTTVDIGTSLAPFVVVYDSTGKVLATDGSLNGEPPTIPNGVLATASNTGRDAVTWQPWQGVRVATVTIPWSGGTVTSGRSLLLTEDRVSTLATLIAAAWIAIVLSVGLASIGGAWLWPAGTDDPERPAR